MYSIGAVAQMLGIPLATLRTREERYGQPVPERSPGGHRVYSRDQVEQLRFVKAQTDKGIPPADAHRLLAERLAAGSVSFGAPQAVETRLLILLAERDPYAAELMSTSCAPRGTRSLRRWTPARLPASSRS